MIFHGICKYESECSIAHLYSQSRLISNHSFRFLNPDKETVTPLCSSNGLVLCAKRIKFKWHYYICNPLTQKSFLLPIPEVPHLKSVTCFTCEISSVSTTYMVVRIPLPDKKRRDSYKYQVQVYASGFEKWKVYHIPAAQGVKWGLTNYDSPVVMQGEMFYWMEKRETIIAFSETGVSELNLPGFAYNVSNLVRCLGESEGMILYARIRRRIERETLELSVWELREENFLLLHKNIPLCGLFARMNSKLDGILLDKGWGNRIQVSFSPADRNVILIGCENYVWTYNINTEVYSELRQPCSATDNYSSRCPPLALKAMPTIVPT